MLLPKSTREHRVAFTHDPNVREQPSYFAKGLGWSRLESGLTFGLPQHRGRVPYARRKACPGLIASLLAGCSIPRRYIPLGSLPQFTSPRARREVSTKCMPFLCSSWGTQTHRSHQAQLHPPTSNPRFPPSRQIEVTPTISVRNENHDV